MRFLVAEFAAATRNIASPIAGSFGSPTGVDAAQLECRILYSASPLEMDLQEIPDASDANLQVGEVGIETANTFESVNVAHEPLMSATYNDALLPESLISSTVDAANGPPELVFVDESVDDYETLVSDLFGREASGREMKVFFLDAARDGVQQISEVLAAQSGIEAVHLVSHGSEGSITLGNARLSSESLERYSAEVSSWGDALTNDADLLIYGCDLAGNQAGRTLTETLGDLCECDVAASVDITGHDSLGGNWDLEFATGAIETPIAFSGEVQQSWLGKLDVINVTQTVDAVNGDTSSVASLTGGGDGGDGISLREAVLAVNNDTGGDTIQLAAGTYTISLGPAGDNTGANGDLDILKSVTITGAGAESTIIDGGSLDRVFHIQDNSTIVDMSDLTIQGGLANHNGAGVFVDDDSTLNISNVTLRNNDGDSGGGGGAGGGIHVHGTLNATSVLFAGNSAKNGGAIFFHNSLGGTLTNVTIAGNSATDNGGGIYTDTTISITDSTITGNNANDGGGVFTSGATVNFSNAVVSGNSATSSNDNVSDSLVAIVDTWLDDASQNTSHGSETMLVLGSDPSTGSNGFDHHPVLKFDLASIPGEAMIDSATLSVFLEDWDHYNTLSPVGVEVRAHALLEDWSEGQATWISRDGSNDWTSPGGELGP